MTTTTTTLSTNEQNNLHTLLATLPEQYAAVDCDTFRTYRPILMATLPLISKIPLYGSKIAAAIQFLIQIGDSVCPPQGQPVTGSAACPDCPGAADPTGIDMLKAAGILHPSVTLDKLVEFQKNVSSFPTSASCAVIGQFVYSGSKS